MGTTFSVSNATELKAAIDAAQGGDRIELAAGEYGELNLTSEQFGGAGVTIASADPDDMAVFDKITLYRCENMHFDSIEIDYEPTGNTGYQVAFRAAEGSDISISNSTLQGGYDEDRESPYDEAPSGLGVQFTRVDNVVVDNNEISEFHAGISVAYIEGLTITDNYVHDVRTSPMAGGAVNDVEVTGNHFASAYPVNFGGTGDHGDMIHLYPLTYQDGPMVNINISDNFFEQGESDQAILGIYLDDAGGGGSGLGYTNVVIDNNIIHNGDAQGLRVENVDGLTVTDNSFIQSSGGGLGSAPGIVLTDGTQNVVVDNNIIAGLISGSSISGGAGAELNIQIGDNIFIQDRDPFGNNYVGDIFVNGLTPNGDVVDFTPLVGSVAEGYGSSLSNFFAQPGDHAGVITDTRGEGLEMRTIHFDAEALYSAYHEVDITNASLVWDFGDGNTASGNNISHTYDSAGTYDVSATFTLPNGRVIEVGHTVDVFTPDAVSIDFEGGVIEDSSDIENAVETSGNYNLESSRFGDALRLVENTSRIEIERTEEILDNPEFSISFAFQKDGGTDSNDDNGMFLYYAGTSYMSTGEGTLAFTGQTSTGRILRLEADADQIEDGAWHHVTYTFSSADRTAILYLDGEEVDRIDDVSGIQHTINGHDLLLGGRTGGAFGGLMDEVEFTRAALTADQVSARYNGLFNPSDNPDQAPGDGGDTPIMEEPPVTGDRSTSGGSTQDFDALPVPTVTVCEDPITQARGDGGATAGTNADEDPMSGPDAMPAPVVNRAPEPEAEAEEDEETIPHHFARWVPDTDESSTVYDSILNSIAATNLQRSEEGEMMRSEAESMELESHGGTRLFGIFDILRDTGRLDENPPPAAAPEDEIHDDEDMFSFLF